MAEGDPRKLSRTDSCDSFFDIDVGKTLSLDDIYKAIVMIVMPSEEIEDTMTLGAHGNPVYSSSDNEDEGVDTSGVGVGGLGCTSTPLTSKQVNSSRPCVDAKAILPVDKAESSQRRGTLEHVDRKYGQSSEDETSSDDDDDDGNDENDGDNDENNNEEDKPEHIHTCKPPIPEITKKRSLKAIDNTTNCREDIHSSSFHSEDNENSTCADTVTMTTTVCSMDTIDSRSCSSTMTSSELGPLACMVEDDDVTVIRSPKCEVEGDDGSVGTLNQHNCASNNTHDNSTTITATSVATATAVVTSTATAAASTGIEAALIATAATTGTTPVLQVHNSQQYDNHTKQQYSLSKHQGVTKTPGLPNGVNTSSTTDHIVYIEYDSKTEEETVLVIQGSRSLGPSEIRNLKFTEVKGSGATEVGADMARVGDTDKLDKQQCHHHVDGLMSLCVLLNKNKTLQCLVSVLVLFMFLTAAAFIMALISVTNHTTCQCTTNDDNVPLRYVFNDGQSCPAGWRIYAGSCYGSVSRQKMNFTEARELCHEHGADMMSIDDREEMEFFSKYFLEPRWRCLNRDDPVFASDLSSSNSSFSETTALLKDFNTTSSCAQLSMNESLRSVDCSTKLHFYCEQRLKT